MNLDWSGNSLSDLARLHAFLLPVDPRAADSILDALTLAAERLLQFPRLGERLDHYAPREVRCIIAGRYEIHYELMVETIFILRIWHMREHR